MKIKIPILANTLFDLSLFDFSFKNISIVDIDSKKFREYVSKFDVNDGANSFIKQIKKKRIGDENLYAIIKLDYEKNEDYDDLYNVLKILLIIDQSNLQILYELQFSNIDGLNVWSMSENDRYPIDLNELFAYGEFYLENANKFIRDNFKKMKTDNFWNLLIQHYLLSFQRYNTNIHFVNLCICLECLTSSKTELIYRTRRSAAILCGKTYKDCETISNNIKKIFNLRSKIVHGQKFDNTKLINYTPYLRKLVSVIIQQLFIHDIKSSNDLDKVIIGLGYGDRQMLSKNNCDVVINPLTEGAILHEIGSIIYPSQIYNTFAELERIIHGQRNARTH